MTTFDLSILPIHRLNGQELANLPGLLAVTPPRKAARGRDKDNLILYLMLSGNAVFSANEIAQLTGNAADVFYQSPGSLTSAMRKAAENINSVLLERNMSTTGRGQYALGLLVLATMRENQCTLLLSGPTHAVWVSEGQSRHIHDPALSGKGLGASQSVQSYLSQVEIHSNDLLVLCARFPTDWEADLLSERPSTSLDASYRKLTFTKGDLNAALIQAQNGHGIITVMHPDISASRPSQPMVAPVIEEFDESESFEPQGEDSHKNIISSLPRTVQNEEPEPKQDAPAISEEELDAMADFAAHIVQPSAYAIPPQPEQVLPLSKEETLSSTPSTTSPRSFPPSIPRANPAVPKIEPIVPEPIIMGEPEEEPEETSETEDIVSSPTKPDKPTAHAEATRQMAKAVVGGIQTGRRVNERLGEFMRRFVPRLVPNSDSTQALVIPSYVMISMAIIIPVLVATVSWVIYDKYGLSERYHELYQNAALASAQANSEIDPARQRDELTRSIEYIDQALEYRETEEAKLLRSQTQAKLDNLMGIVRLEFISAFTGGLGGSAQISRMAASESDLYMLDAERGSILHASFTGRSLELDSAFNCQPGTYSGYQVGTLVDILALPKVNAVSATVLGIDSTGNLLYCAPGQVPQAFPLPPLPNTNWGRITSFILDNGNLYVLDAEARAVWVFVGKDSTFIDTPYFYFGNQIPNIDNAIDLGVSGDDLYLLHADGHLSTCTFSRLNEVPTRCTDPAPRVDNFAAHKDIDVFAQAHFTQMSLTNPPNPVVLLLDSENRSVFRFSPRSLELQNQVTGFSGKGNPFQTGPVGAIAVSPNYVLYLAIGNQVYFATNLP